MTEPGDLLPVHPGDLLPVSGPAAPPRANGELVFAAPWESRTFGLTLALHERGLFAWSSFQEKLIEAIARWEADRPRAAGSETPVEYPYYRCWQQALEALLADLGLCAPTDLEDRARTLADRAHGHDH